jgi:hypothetical protein
MICGQTYFKGPPINMRPKIFHFHNFSLENKTYLAEIFALLGHLVSSLSLVKILWILILVYCGAKVV